jgi:hypothetical protein
MATCLACGTFFQAKRASAKFCGNTCRQRVHRWDRASDARAVGAGAVTELREGDCLPAKNVTLDAVGTKGEILAEIDGFPVLDSRYFEVRGLADEAPDIGSGLRRVFVLAEVEDRHGAAAFASVTIFSPASGAVATIARSIWRDLRPRLIDDFDRDRMRRLLAEDRNAAWNQHRAHRPETEREAA